MKATTTVAAQTVVAEICLYGGTNGAGYLAHLGSGIVPGVKMFGDGNPVASRSLTDAMWLAVLELQAALGSWSRGDVVRVFEPSGRRMALMPIGMPVYFGELTWEAAPVYVISADDILKHATEVR